MITLNCIYVTLYFYKNTFNISTVRIKITRSTIGYSEVAKLLFSLSARSVLEPCSRLMFLIGKGELRALSAFGDSSESVGSRNCDCSSGGLVGIM